MSKPCLPYSRSAEWEVLQRIEVMGSERLLSNLKPHSKSMIACAGIFLTDPEGNFTSKSPHWHDVQALLGEGAGVVLEGQKVLPARVEQEGYTFKFPDVNSAVKNILRWDVEHLDKLCFTSEARGHWVGVLFAYKRAGQIPSCLAEMIVRLPCLDPIIDKEIGWMLHGTSCGYPWKTRETKTWYNFVSIYRLSWGIGHVHQNCFKRLLCPWMCRWDFAYLPFLDLSAFRWRLALTWVPLLPNCQGFTSPSDLH